MSYTPKTWTTGEIVATVYMNNIEQGIAGAYSSATTEAAGRIKIAAAADVLAGTGTDTACCPADTVSAINAVKVKKFGDYGLQSLRNINFADALVSIFALQMAMVATFGGADDGGMYILNIFVGAFVFIATFALGIFMIVRAATRLNKLPSAKREQMSEGAAETADMPAGEEK